MTQPSMTEEGDKRRLVEVIFNVYFVILFRAAIGLFRTFIV